MLISYVFDGIVDLLILGRGDSFFCVWMGTLGWEGGIDVIKTSGGRK